MAKSHTLFYERFYYEKYLLYAPIAYWLSYQIVDKLSQNFFFNSLNSFSIQEDVMKKHIGILSNYFAIETLNFGNKQHTDILINKTKGIIN